MSDLTFLCNYMFEFFHQRLDRKDKLRRKGFENQFMIFDISVRIINFGNFPGSAKNNDLLF